MYALAVGSITTAQRGKSILNKNGIKCGIQRYYGEKQIGCGYVLTVSDNIDKCRNILNSVGIKILDVSKK
ncbi:MAG: DUF3343 domain-containing protein [Ruminococcaceae bacterium]|nr:DUF3343 domain-containing protein [Oscillospiraceae bacterium]